MTSDSNLPDGNAQRIEKGAYCCGQITFTQWEPVRCHLYREMGNSYSLDKITYLEVDHSTQHTTAGMERKKGCASAPNTLF